MTDQSGISPGRRTFCSRLGGLLDRLAVIELSDSEVLAMRVRRLEHEISSLKVRK